MLGLPRQRPPAQRRGGPAQLITGKPSDLAGYFLFPSLLAVPLRVRTRGGLSRLSPGERRLAAAH